MKEWSNGDTLYFLECYRQEPCIWDPGNSDHKNKRNVADAWLRISKLLYKPVKELKIKKEILMVTFRKHFGKKQQSIRAGMKQKYEPNWFAYPLMESFLMPIYKMKLGLNSETQSRSSETTIDEAEETEHDNSMAVPSPSGVEVSAPFVRNSTEKSRSRPTLKSAEQQMATAFIQLKDILNQRQLRPSATDNDDECNLYGKLLVKKLRELPKDERSVMMYEIDGLFIQRIKQKSLSRHAQSQYCPYSRPSSTPSGYIQTNQPSCTQPSFPEPNSTSHHGPFTTNDTSNLMGTSTSLLQSMSQNTDEEIIINSNEPNNLQPRSPINTRSDETVIPSKQNIIKEEFLNECEDTA